MRHLPHYRCELVAQRLGALALQTDRRQRIGELLIMREIAIAFYGEAKVCGCLVSPARKGLFFLQTIERRVDLDGAEALGTEMQPVLLRNTGVEALLKCGRSLSRSPDFVWLAVLGGRRLASPAGATDHAP
jgi:hypothetical protein